MRSLCMRLVVEMRNACITKIGADYYFEIHKPQGALRETQGSRGNYPCESCVFHCVLCGSCIFL
jgi:hypothetical protein